MISILNPRLHAFGALGIGALLLAVVSCAGTDTLAQAGTGPRSGSSPYGTYVPDLPTSHPPFTEFHASWKQRMDDPYIYVDHYGSYVDTGAHIPTLLREMELQGLTPAGPPFCLFYDDPAQVPVAELRSRACVPISGPRSPRSPLRYDVLPSRTIAHAFVSGPYPDAPRCYPKLFAYMASMNWVDDGPILERYIVAPGTARASSDLLCEVQVPIRIRD